MIFYKIVKLLVKLNLRLKSTCFCLLCWYDADPLLCRLLCHGSDRRPTSLRSRKCVRSLHWSETQTDTGKHVSWTPTRGKSRRRWSRWKQTLNFVILFNYQSHLDVWEELEEEFYSWTQFLIISMTFWSAITMKMIWNPQNFCLFPVFLGRSWDRCQHWQRARRRRTVKPMLPTLPPSTRWFICRTRAKISQIRISNKKCFIWLGYEVKPVCVHTLGVWCDRFNDYDQGVREEPVRQGAAGPRWLLHSG